MDETITPRVLVATPTSGYKEYCEEEFIHQITSLDYPSYDIFIVDNTLEDLDAETTPRIDRLRSLFDEQDFKGTAVVAKDVWCFDPTRRVATSYNKIRDFFLRGPWTHLLIIESDIFPDDKSFLKRWIREDKPVITAPYTLGMIIQSPKEEEKNIPKAAMWYKRPIIFGQLEFYRWVALDDILPGIRELDFTIGGFGTGLVLLHREVLQQIIFRNEQKGTPDKCLKSDLDDYGIKSYLDGSLKIRHEQQVWDKLLQKDYATIKELKYCGDHLKRSPIMTTKDMHEFMQQYSRMVKK